MGLCRGGGAGPFNRGALYFDFGWTKIDRASWSGYLDWNCLAWITSCVRNGVVVELEGEVAEQILGNPGKHAISAARGMARRSQLYTPQLAA